MERILDSREFSIQPNNTDIDKYLDEDYLVEKLYNTDVLEGHSGCVNTLCWNESGSLLASGSDDRSIIIWRGGGGGKIHGIETNHMGNIFAVQFLPAKRDDVIVTGAADHTIMMHHVEYGNDVSWTTEGRVKRMCTLRSDPFLFWAASEEATLRQYDTRTNDVEKLITINETHVGIKSMAVCEAKPNLIALALDKTEVPIYDRRQTRDPILTLHPCDPTAKHMYSTHVAFNSAGTELIVNQGGGSVFVYDLDETKNPDTFNRLDQLLKYNGPVESISSATLPYPEERKIGSDMLKNEKFTEAYDYYSRQLEKNYPERDMRSILYTNKGLALLARRLRGDSYGCLRECVMGLEENPGNSKALWRIARSCLIMEQWELARKCCLEFRRRFPNDKTVTKLEKQIADATGTEKNIDDLMKMQDYKERYTGQMNFDTDIKEANFFGSKDQYIVTGSDCGTMMMWNRKNGTLMAAWKADSRILNIIQPHPQLFMLATSGIDDEIRLWQPSFDHPDDFEDIYRVTEPYEFIAAKREENASRLNIGMIAHSMFRQHPECVTS